MGRYLVIAALLLTGHAAAQSSADLLTKLHKLQLKESPGPVPLIYSASSEEHALRWQRSLAAAREWFQKQLHKDVPFTLVVLDRDPWRAVTNEVLGYALVKPGLVMMPEHIEDIYPTAPKNLDPVLGAEAMSFHEAGHIFADSLNLDANTFIGELFANIFMAGYIRAARPDLVFILNRPLPDMKTPRYTSGGDLNYLAQGVGVQNYIWFEMELQHLADFCVRNRSFASVVANMVAAFPAEHPRHVTIDEASARLEALFPGFKAAAGRISDPPTMTRITPSDCREPAVRNSGSGEFRGMVVRNDTASPLDLTRSDGSKIHVNPYAWRGFRVPVGTSVRMSDGACLGVGEPGEPLLAIIDKLRQPE